MGRARESGGAPPQLPSFIIHELARWKMGGRHLGCDVHDLLRARASHTIKSIGWRPASSGICLPAGNPFLKTWPTIRSGSGGRFLRSGTWQPLDPTASLVAAAAGLVVLDPHDEPYFRRTQSFSHFNKALSGKNTIIGMAALPASVYAFSLARRECNAQRTVRLRTEAVLNAELVRLVIRNITRRLSPNETEGVLPRRVRWCQCKDINNIVEDFTRRAWARLCGQLSGGFQV